MRKFGKYASLAVLFSLLIFSLNGCNSNKDPTAAFSANPSTGGAPLQVSFDADNSKDPDGIIDEFEWEFGDGTTGNGSAIKHTYENPGEYTITLTVTDNDGSTATTTGIVTVEPSPPTAELSADTKKGEAPLTVSFDLSGSGDPDGAIEEYNLKFGDGNSTSGTDLLNVIEHTYKKSEEYTPKLEVVDGDDLTATDTATITVNKPPPENENPSAAISTSTQSGTAPLTVEFSTKESSDPDGEIQSYRWEFGDGSTSSGSTVSHRFENAGEYTVKLTVTDDRDGKATAEKTIIVNPTTYYVGESASNGFVRITLLEANMTESIGGRQSEAGRQFVVVSVTVKALKDNQYPSKTLNFKLEESSGRTQPISLATAALDGYFQSDILDQGDISRGKIAFEAQKSSKFYYLIYETSGQPPIQFRIENPNSQ